MPRPKSELTSSQKCVGAKPKSRWELLGFAWVAAKCSLTSLLQIFISALGKFPISIMIMSDRIHTLIGFLTGVNDGF